MAALAWNLTGNTATTPNEDFVGTTDKEPLVIRTSNVERLRVDPAGNVGVGTPNPYTQLHIRKDANSALGPSLTLTNAAGGSGAGASVDFNGCDFGNTVPPTARIQSLDDGHYSSHLTFLTKNPGGPDHALTEAMRVTSAGNVGIGLTNPAEKLDVLGNLCLRCIGPTGLDAGGNPRTAFSSLKISLEVPAVHFWTQAGNTQGGAFQADIEFHQNVRIAAPYDLLLCSADLAEEFDIAPLDTAEPGSVVVLDDQGGVRASDQPYDHRVAGVISGAGEYKPAIILDKKPDQRNRSSVALTGKVYCNVDADCSPVRIGDLLTTSPTPGHAMKAADQQRSFGAVLGKALAPLESGRGLIPILVSLQ